MADTPALTPHRITVLLVDDQLLIGEAVRRMLLSEKDIDFHFCQDPTRALNTARAISPTVILQDLVMPAIDGLLLVRHFREDPATRDVPLIVLSSKEEPGIKAEAFGLGANDYLVKLPDRLEVIARIRYHSRGYINFLERNEAFGQLERANRFIRSTFGRYLSDDIVNTILESPEGLSLGGEKRTVTIMMSDLRGFTAMSERLLPESVVGILNQYLEAMTEIILKHQGTIDEFIGDAILSIFGAPIKREDDAQRAVACALEMQGAMAEVNRKNRALGYPLLEMGIGINTGDVVVGNIGSSKRAKYGVVGRQVNLTSRIESYTVGGQIYISPSTMAACGAVLRIDSELEIMPKGVREPIKIYEIGGIAGPYGINLPAKKAIELNPLPQPLPIEVTLLEGKHAGRERHPGLICKMTERLLEIQAPIRAEKLNNLKLWLRNSQNQELNADLYAKVLEVTSASPAAFRVALTSVPPEAEAFLKQILASPAAAP